MRGNLIVVDIFGVKNIELFSSDNAPSFEAREFDCRCYADDSELSYLLVKDNPDVILTVGNWESFKNLCASSYNIRRKWIHKDNLDDISEVGRSVMGCYITNCTTKREEPALVSVFTPTYKIGNRIYRAFESMKNQTYSNWEWVIFDDSEDNNKTFDILDNIASEEPRISLYRSNTNSGIIGEVKHRACMLAKGEILVELDHDDELTIDGIEMVVKAFKQYPEAGFAYTDCAEVFENGTMATYGEGWGLGYGSYRDEEYKGMHLKVTNYPVVNSRTIRHIVGVPNHIRAWKKDVYYAIGGHNRQIHVCDDYELILRTFLHTRIVKIPKLGYIQYHSLTGSNTQRKRNAEIQRLVRYFRNSYDKRIHKRFEELGIDDFVWNEKLGLSDMNIEGQPDSPHCCLIADVD